MRLLLVIALLGCGSKEELEAPQARLMGEVSKGVTITPRAPALPAKPVVPGLEDDLRDADPKVRRAAIREAAKEGADAQVFLAASRDPDREVAILATDALGKLHAKGEVPAAELIARVVDKSIDERVRVSAINGLGVVASPEAAQALVELVARGDMLERRSAAILLSHQDPELAIPALITALGDADEVVRANALESLRARARGRDFGNDASAWRTWWQSRSR